jgi:hypothetical protein
MNFFLKVTGMKCQTIFFSIKSNGDEAFNAEKKMVAMKQ